MLGVAYWIHNRTFKPLLNQGRCVRFPYFSDKNCLFSIVVSLEIYLVDLYCIDNEENCQNLTLFSELKTRISSSFKGTVMNRISQFKNEGSLEIPLTVTLRLILGFKFFYLIKKFDLINNCEQYR